MCVCAFLCFGPNHIEVAEHEELYYGSKADRLNYLVSSQPCAQMPCRSSACSYEAYFVLALVHAYMSKPLTDMSQAKAAVSCPAQTS